LDAGALIAVDKNDRRVLLMLDDARLHGRRITIPATVLAQVMRNPERQFRLNSLASDLRTEIAVLDANDAVNVGKLLAETGTSDIIDAHVVICAHRCGQAVVTSDPLDLKRLAPHLQLILA